MSARTAALAEAVSHARTAIDGGGVYTGTGRWVSAEDFAAAILAALPADWCGHTASDAERWRMHLECEWEADAEIARLRSILALHNKTPTGRTRKCLPGCIACAALEEKP
jgi:hypothetical protein